MHIEGENVLKSSTLYDEFEAFDKRHNIRMYNDGGDRSKSSFASDELSTLRTDLYNATKSLEKSLSMAESLKVNLNIRLLSLSIQTVSMFRDQGITSKCGCR